MLGKYFSISWLLYSGNTYSPAAIESAPVTKPASVANITGSRFALAAATPMAMLAVFTSSNLKVKNIEICSELSDN